MHNTKSEWYKRATGEESRAYFGTQTPGVIAWKSLIEKYGEIDLWPLEIINRFIAT